MSSTLAQRDPPMRLSPSAIPLAVTTTPKSTAAGTEGSMAYHPTAQGVPHTCKPPPPSKVCLPLITDGINKQQVTEKKLVPRVLIGIC